MGKSERNYLYVCSNCDHEFYRVTMTGHSVQCPQCEEMSAFLEDEPDEVDDSYGNSTYEDDEDASFDYNDDESYEEGYTEEYDQ